MNRSLATARLKVLVGGRELSAQQNDALVEARIVLVVNAVSSCELRFFGGDGFDESKFKMDEQVEVRIGVGDPADEVFSGVIHAIAIELSDSAIPETVIECHDPSWKLASTTVRKAFSKKSLADIVRGVGGDAGLSVDTDLEGGALGYRLEAGSALETLNEIVSRTGRIWWVEGTKLHVQKPKPSGSCATLKAGEDLVRFEARLSSSEQAESVDVWGWDDRQKSVISGTAKTTTGGYDANPSAVTAATRDHRGAAQPAVDLRHAPVDSDDAKAIAQAGLDRRASAHITGWGEVVPAQPTLRPGQFVTIENVGTSWAGSYPLTRVEHRIRPGVPLRSQFEIGSIEGPRLTDLVTRTRPPRRILEGVTIGIVTELWSDKSDSLAPRVKVKFPYLRDATGIELESNWARIVMPGAGNKRGLFVLPEVDDEVIVTFEHGDLDRPLIIGGVWNDKDVPVQKHTDVVKSTKTEARSFTTRKGHQWVFTDEPIANRQSGFAVELKNGAKIEVSEEEVTVDSMKKPITITGAGASCIKIDDQGNITIEGASITMKAKQNIEIESGTDIAVTAGTGVTAEAGTNLEFTDKAGTKLTSAAIVEIKGSLVKVNG